MLSNIYRLSENYKNSIGLVSLTIVIFFTFFVLNIFFGPDPNAEKKIAEEKKIQEQANESNLFEQLTKKYGAGDLDITTGKFTPAE